MTSGSPDTVDADLVDLMQRVFAAHRAAHPRTDDPADRDDPVWSRLGELGLARLTASERDGGSGAGWHEAAALLTAAATAGVRVPFAEHDLLAGWILATAGLPVDDALRTLAEVDADGVARAVPWAERADRVAVVWHDGGSHRVADVAAAALSITPGVNLAGEPRDTVAVDTTVLDGTSVPREVVDRLHLRGALVRAIQVCAALDAILAASVAHTTERTQFGRPLAKFQAVQHLVADIAAEAALARAATEAALGEAVRTGWSGDSVPFHIAVARSCAGHAVSVAVRNGHQVHGATGTTREHRLHEFTGAALAWRGEYGSLRHWDETIARAAATAGRDGLWALVTS